MKLYLPYYYDDVKDMFLHFCNKYWPEMEVGCFPNKTPVGWTDKIIQHLSGIKDEYFVTVPEDFWFIEKVNHSIFEKILSFVESNHPDKVELTGTCYVGLEEIESKTDHDGVTFSLAKQDLPYRCSLHPSIWRREYFLGIARPGQNWWKFELCQRALNDGGKIYGCSPAPMGKIVNFMWRGKTNPKHLTKYIDPEDKKHVEAIEAKYK